MSWPKVCSVTGLCHTPDCTKHRSERLNSLLNQLIIFRFLFFFSFFCDMATGLSWNRCWKMYECLSCVLIWQISVPGLLSSWQADGRHGLEDSKINKLIRVEAPYLSTFLSVTSEGAGFKPCSNMRSGFSCSCQDFVWLQSQQTPWDVGVPTDEISSYCSGTMCPHCLSFFYC